MRITIIGTGNAATVLARMFIQKGHIIRNIIGRNEQKAKELADECGTGFSNIKEQVNLDTDLFIISLSDNSFPESLDKIQVQHIPVFHTGGALSINVLKNCGDNYGVLYPLQSLSKESDSLENIPFLVDGSNDYTKQVVENFAATLSDNITFANDDTRLRLHAAAVIVNNFTNYLYHIAKEFCDNELVDFNLLKPLIIETAQRVMKNNPADVQTGPALRKDNITLDKHLRLFSSYPKLRTLYMRMTDSIMNG